MKKLIDKQVSAIKMRKQGFSINEIAGLLCIAKSSASLWLRDVQIDQVARNILLEKKSLARDKAHKVLAEKRENQQTMRLKSVAIDLERIPFTPELYKLLTAIFIWTEGMKASLARLSFINSDPVMIKTFMTVFRRAFIVDEQKLRALVHIHEYHNNEEVKEFWSQLTGIPLSQFHKSYRKPNTGKSFRQNYMGCVTVVYYDSQVAREIKVLYNRFSETVCI